MLRLVQTASLISRKGSIANTTSTSMLRNGAALASACASPLSSSASVYLHQQKRASSSSSSLSDAESQLVKEHTEDARMRRKKMSIFEEISGGVGGSIGGGPLVTGGQQSGGSSPFSAGGAMSGAASGGVGPSSSSFSSSSLRAAGGLAAPETGACPQTGRHMIAGWVSSPLVTMEEGPIPGVYIIRINNPPVNTCTTEVLRGLLYCLYKLAGTFDNDVQDAAKPNPWDRSGTVHMNRCRGVVLHSSVPNIFSAGMDLDQLLSVGADAEAERAAKEKEKEGSAASAADPSSAEGSSSSPSSTATSTTSTPFDPTTHTPDGKRIPYASFVQYWGTLQHLQFTLLGYPVPLVAAISGDAPAGGCLLSMLCDYRVMAARSAAAPQRLFKIGMTSARAGFVVPPWIAATMRHTIGPKHTEAFQTLGLMVTAEEAKESYGLVDQVSETDETVLLDALAAMEFLLGNIPFQHTFWHIKESMRRPLIDMLETKDKRLDDVSKYIAHLSSPTVYANLKSYKESLSGKRSNQGNKDAKE